MYGKVSDRGYEGELSVSTRNLLGVYGGFYFFNYIL